MKIVRTAEGMDEELVVLAEVGGGVIRSGRQTKSRSTWDLNSGQCSLSTSVLEFEKYSCGEISFKTWPDSFGYLVRLPSTG